MLRTIFSIVNLNKKISSKKIYRDIQNLSCSSSAIEEKKINIKGININYIKTGTGKHKVLFLPSTLGSIWTDFKMQIDFLDKTKFTIVALDPPGFGKSRPPNRDLSGDFFARDADFAYELMKTLGFLKYSVVGWSGGSITSMIAAAKYPQNIDKLILIGSLVYLSSAEIACYKYLRNLNGWSDNMKRNLIDIYGEEYLIKVWNEFLDAMINIYEKRNGDICSKSASEIKCPVLIVHGAKDIFISLKQGMILHKTIPNSRMKIFENAKHNVHIKYPTEFNKILLDFLLEKN